MSYEIEIKYRLKDPAALRTALKRLGAKRLGVDSERNELYDHAALGLKKRGCALRVRQTGPGKGILTYKGPASRGPVKRRLEIETAVDPEAVRQMLARLGFQSKLRYDKVRETHELGNCLVTVDRLKGHGYFAEIEGPRARILKLERSLGFKPSDREERTYAQITSGL